MRIGFIGGWGHHMLRGLLQQDPGQITAIAVAGDGCDQQAAQARVTSLPGSTWFDDARQMLDRFKPDVVNVGAVYGHNNTWVVECINRGIPVLSDKPIAASWEQYERLVEAVRQRPGARAITEFCIRSSPAIRAAQKVIAAGRIGEVVLATAQKSYRFGTGRPAWYADRDQYGGTILWVAGHAIDYIRYATGRPFVRVFGRQQNVSKTSYGSMEEATVNVLELSNRALAVVHADYNRPAKAPTHGDDRLRVVGASGIVEVRDEHCVIMSHDEPPTDITALGDGPSATMELLAALRGDQSVFSTAQSVEMARVLLVCRDAADQQRQLDIAP